MGRPPLRAVACNAKVFWSPEPGPGPGPVTETERILRLAASLGRVSRMHSRHQRPHRLQLLASRAADMRHRLTESEARLWACLRGRRLGVTFRRQLVIGNSIVDFCAPVARLVVEVDGGYHARRVHADARRDRALAQAGYRVLRIDADLVMRDLPAAVALVRDALARAHGC